MCSKIDDGAPTYANVLRQSSIWSKEIECGLGMKTGDCLNNECVCSKGFQHDLSYVRFRNCSLPTLFYPVIMGLQLLALLIIIPYVFMKFRVTKSIAKLSLFSTLMASGLYLVFCICFILYRFEFNSLLFFLLYLIIFSFSISNGITIYSLVSPLSAVAGKSRKPLKHAIIATIAFFRILGLIPVVIASGWYDYPSDSTKDKLWSYLTNTFSFCVAMESVAFISLFVIYGTKMVKLIEEISNSHVTSQHSKFSKPYLKKVKELIFRNKVVLAPLVVVLCVVPIVQFVAGSIPFNYVFFGFSLLNVPLLIFIVAKYSSRSTVKMEESASSKTKTGRDTSLKSYSDRSMRDSKLFVVAAQPRNDIEQVSLSCDMRDIMINNTVCQQETATQADS